MYYRKAQWPVFVLFPVIATSLAPNSSRSFNYNISISLLSHCRRNRLAHNPINRPKKLYREKRANAKHFEKRQRPATRCLFTRKTKFDVFATIAKPFFASFRFMESCLRARIRTLVQIFDSRRSKSHQRNVLQVRKKMI